MVKDVYRISLEKFISIMDLKRELKEIKELNDLYYEIIRMFEILNALESDAVVV